MKNLKEFYIRCYVVPYMIFSAYHNIYTYISL